MDTRIHPREPALGLMHQQMSWIAPRSKVLIAERSATIAGSRTEIHMTRIHQLKLVANESRLKPTAATPRLALKPFTHAHFFFFLAAFFADLVAAGLAADFFLPEKTESQFVVNVLVGAERTIGPDMREVLREELRGIHRNPKRQRGNLERIFPR